MVADIVITSLKIEEMRQACNILLDEIGRRYGSEILLTDASFKDDHYWDLPVEAAFQLVDKPELHIVAGQTTDDVAELRGVLAGDGNPQEIVLGHDLSHLASLLRRIAFLDTRPCRG